jgi:hypothetical protein
MEQLEILAERNGLGLFCENRWKNMLKSAVHALVPLQMGALMR